MLRIKDIVSNDDAALVDYDRLATSFAYLYFLENFWKAWFVFVRDNPPNAQRIIDAGSGSGATLIAYLSFLESKVRADKWTVRVSCLDRSGEQLDLARKMFETVRDEFVHLNVIPEFETTDLKDWSPVDSETDAVFFGHVLSENRGNSMSLIEKGLRALSGGGRLYVIERFKDPIWNDIEHFATQFAYPMSYGQLEEYSDVLPPALRRDDEDKHYLKSRYSVLHAPRLKWLTEIVRKYFEAWTRGSVSLLSNVFSQDADYSDKPHEPPMHGIKSIESYWRSEVLTQDNRVPRILNVAYSEDEAFVEWRAEFSRKAIRSNLQGVMIFTVDREIRLTSSFREYYTSSHAETSKE